MVWGSTEAPPEEGGRGARVSGCGPAGRQQCGAEDGCEACGVRDHCCVGYGAVGAGCCWTWVGGGRCWIRAWLCRTCMRAGSQKARCQRLAWPDDDAGLFTLAFAGMRLANAVGAGTGQGGLCELWTPNRCYIQLVGPTKARFRGAKSRGGGWCHSDRKEYTWQHRGTNERVPTHAKGNCNNQRGASDVRLNHAQCLSKKRPRYDVKFSKVQCRFASLP